MPQLHPTPSETGAMGFIYSPLAEQTARQLEGLSHYLFPKMVVVTWCVFVWYHKGTLPQKKLSLGGTP